MPINHRLGTEEDLAKLPALIIGFGKRLTPEQILADENDDEPCDDAAKTGLPTRLRTGQGVCRSRVDGGLREQ
jgi:hypothetical protein